MKKSYLTPFIQRQFMIKDNFELFYYEDTTTYNVKQHTHNYHEFYFFIDGDVTMNIANSNFKLKSGDIIFIPPNHPHYIINHDPKKPYRRFVLWVNNSFYKNIMQRANEYKFIIDHSKENKQLVYSSSLITFNNFQTKLFNIIEEMNENNFGKEQKIILNVLDVLLDINRMAYEDISQITSHHTSNLTNQIVEYIDDHIKENLSLDEIANNFYVSKYHIAHIFKEKYGISIHKFITKRRLEICCNDIMNDLNITDVFNRYGFKDYSSFYRAFKKEYGLSPKEYKDVHKLPNQD